MSSPQHCDHCYDHHTSPYAGECPGLVCAACEAKDKEIAALQAATCKLVEALRCHRTGHPCGTDTTLAGRECQCPACAVTASPVFAKFLFRDLGRYIEQDLVRRAVVGGMALDAACAFVRDAKVAFGQ